MTLGHIFRGWLLFSSIEKQSYKVENYEISNYTKKMKTFTFINLVSGSKCAEKIFLIKCGNVKLFIEKASNHAILAT